MILIVTSIMYFTLAIRTLLGSYNLAIDLESIKAFFSKKEKELAVAVAKAEALARQIDGLRAGRGISLNGLDASQLAQLEKLRDELAVSEWFDHGQTSDRCLAFLVFN